MLRYLFLVLQAMLTQHGLMRNIMRRSRQHHLRSCLKRLQALLRHKAMQCRCMPSLLSNKDSTNTRYMLSECI